MWLAAVGPAVSLMPALLKTSTRPRSAWTTATNESKARRSSVAHRRVLAVLAFVRD